MRELTEVAGRAYGRKDLRDVLISLDQHKVEDFASNGFRPRTRTWPRSRQLGIVSDRADHGQQMISFGIEGTV
jgi:hypothetical protein